ncbi:ABC transporter ATP-binding protein [Hyperthermus butylicus]|uniref:ABC transporter n=1 Tax=Hyperthermus butylicus (strain DSM 5456 / JCM 9403 / PLM1-5) TaxID=415426 RepID=A2BMQ2_HYPBU|nr:ABC transporter ATP-binding protein [Hyperthermus butylicus]ABM81263.1 putative ABC transporter [Hyperthermus butylicus DSM 5456]
MPSGYAIIANGLVKRYTTWERRGFLKRVKRVVEALRGVSFTVRWGEVFGLLGPNGAGKTTTVKIISTLLLPDKGTASVAGYDVVSEPVRVRERIGVVLSVERGFFWKLTGRENLRYFGMLRGLRGRQLDEAVERAVRLVGLDELGAVNKLYEEYSLGMKARLALARALLHDPPVLILDEPTLGLDPPSARRIRELLIRLARENGKAVLITTHNMFEAEIVCDRVAIISEGRIAAIGSPDELKGMVAKSVTVTVRFRAHRAAATSLTGLEEGIAKALGTRNLRVEEEEGSNNLRLRVLVKPGEEEETISRVVAVLSGLGYSVRSIEVGKPTLEDVFIALTRRGEQA